MDKYKKVVRMSKKIKYFAKVQEAFSENDEFKIRGIAINSCTTRNGVSYMSEELEKAAPSLRNKPVLKDHNNSVDSIVGKTTENVTYDYMTKNVKFEAVIRDSKMQEMINEGLIGSVSIGAMVQKVERETEGGPLVARGIDFVEISLVAVPADPNAGFQKAIAESFDTADFEDEDDTDDDKEVFEKLEVKKMTEDKVLEEKTRVLEEQNLALQAKVKEFEEKEMNALREKYKKLVTEKGVTAKEGFEKLSREILEAVISTLESMKTMEVKNETKGEVKEETKVDVLPFRIERAETGKVFCLYEEDLGKKNLRYAR
jgi:hypothetical protein